MITSTSPRDGAISETGLEPTTPQQLDDTIAAATTAFEEMQESWHRERRAVLLETMADSVERRRLELVTIADRETALGEARLNGELSRSVFQLRLFAEALREGSYLEAAVDHAAQTPLGPGPDVRRMLVPLGPVVVYGSSNFPFAFSVLGGDTASAIAAGCPVILKAHGSHPLTATASFDALREAAIAAGAPEGVVGIVYGQEAGIRAVRHPAVRAVSLTGSLTAARAIEAAIAERAEPIPFFGELSSLNPLLVTLAAAQQRSHEIAAGLSASVLGSGGQLCTKPGIVLVPTGNAGDALVTQLADRFREAPSAVLLNSRIRDAFVDIEERLLGQGAALVAHGSSAEAESFSVAPAILEIEANDFTGELAQECFGPLVMIVRYAGIENALSAMEKVPGSLTATVQGVPGEPGLSSIFRRLLPLAGRLLFNDYPTGVRVSWAQHHGGPWPSTNTQFTSVGVTALRRWLRPVAWQNMPTDVLPEELRDGERIVPIRIDGILTLPEDS
jgi:NADP-dependent aldehyde dehydrogenase